MIKNRKKDTLLSYGKQSISDTDIIAVKQVLKSPFLTQGPMVEKFEKALCLYTGAKYCVAVSSGTAALHLSLAVLGLKKGSSGVTSPITFLASANAMVYAGIKPLFSDIDLDTVNLSAESLKKNILKSTKVIVPVHFAGRPADMKEILAIALRKKCFVIEDAAHALGSLYSDGSKVGSCRYSDMTTFSFHSIKTITTGEGGAITTNNKKLYSTLKCLRSHGVTKEPGKFAHNPGPWYYEMQDLGYNCRLTDIQSALGISQLKRISKFIARRREIVKDYNKAFKNLLWLRPPDNSNINYTAFHLYVTCIDFKKLNKSRSKVMEILRKKGIGTQVHYIPVYLQPYYRKRFGYSKGLCPCAESYYEQALSLPLFPTMTDEDVNYVIEAIFLLSKDI